MKLINVKKIIGLSLLCICFSVFADQDNEHNTQTPSMWDNIKKTLTDTWNSDTYELYVPLNTWHNRATYDRENIDSYNERPWGIGIGVSRFDEDGDWHSLYIMEFQDSHNVIEPIGGYAYQTYWRPTEKLKFGIGYTLSITARKDYN